MSPGIRVCDRICEFVEEMDRAGIWRNLVLTRLREMESEQGRAEQLRASILKGNT